LGKHKNTLFKKFVLRVYIDLRTSGTSPGRR